MLYAQMVCSMLQLSIPSFSRIGSLGQIDDFTWGVTRRPLSMITNDLKRRGGLPRSMLPDENTTFETSSSYLEALAYPNMEHLAPKE